MAAVDPHLVLIGFSGTGKSTIGRLVASRLRLPFFDVDAMVEDEAGQPIASIFSGEGEDGFRRRESAALDRVLAGPPAVVATGGGIVTRPENRDLLAARTTVVCLEARAETILRRLETQLSDNPSAARPLLTDDDRLGRIVELKQKRSFLYSQADWTVHTDRLTTEQVADEVVHGWSTLRSSTALPFPCSAVVRTAAGACPIVVGAGLLDNVGRYLRDVGLSGRAWLLADQNALMRYGKRVTDSLAQAGFAFDVRPIESGETSKALGVAAELYAWLASNKAERREPIVALGGGVAGDLAGFVAATYLRGVPFVQIPTTLLAMTDAAIGGKTGVNLSAGKNLVGAFHQPRLVLADVSTLETLPRREFVAGWAETIKHALIRDPDLLDRLETYAEKLLSRDLDTLSDVVSRSVAIKAAVVSADEREDGLRMILNYGHTMGHAIEAAGDYQLLLHGEAVAIGMRGAAELATSIGSLDSAVAERQAKILRRFGLPVKAPGVSAERALNAMALDKKIREKKIRWVLLERVGQPVIRGDVDPELAYSILVNLV